MLEQGRREDITWGRMHAHAAMGQGVETFVLTLKLVVRIVQVYSLVFVVVVVCMCMCGWVYAFRCEL